MHAFIASGIEKRGNADVQPLKALSILSRDGAQLDVGNLADDSFTPNRMSTVEQMHSTQSYRLI